MTAILRKERSDHVNERVRKTEGTEENIATKERIAIITYMAFQFGPFSVKLFFLVSLCRVLFAKRIP